MEHIPLLMLHGALGDKQQLEPLATALEDSFEIHRLDFEGHGNAAGTDRLFRIRYFVENVLDYLEHHSLKAINIFGYSMGGYVALYLALRESVKINRIATLGTVLRWNEEKADTETAYLHPEKMVEKVPHFVRKLKERHRENWEGVVNKTRDLLEHLGHSAPIGKDDWSRFSLPVRLHVGDRDNTSGMNDTVDIYRHLDQGELAVLPRSFHPLEQLNLRLLIPSLVEFFSDKDI